MGCLVRDCRPEVPDPRHASITRIFHRSENHDFPADIQLFDTMLPETCGAGVSLKLIHTSTDERLELMAEVEDTQTWPELAISLYDKLTGRGAEITYEFEDFELFVPSKAGDDPEYAHWKMDGTLKIRTKENGTG